MVDLVWCCSHVDIMGIFLTSCKDEFIDHYIENVEYKMGLKFQTQVSVTLNFVEEGDEAFF